MPIDIIQEGENTFILALKTGRRYFKEPFFIDSLYIHYKIPLKDIHLEIDALTRSFEGLENNQDIIKIPLNDFIEYYLHKGADCKSLFIFHMSRCGSTLISQMLSEVGSFFVVSEPPIINKILDPNLLLPQNLVKDLIKSSINAIKDCCPRPATFAVIKFRSWNVLFIEQMLNAFAEVPWMFVHRNGPEVLSSLIIKPAGWVRSKQLYSKFYAEQLGLDIGYVKNCDESEFVGRMLGLYCKTALKFKNKRSQFLDYIDIKTSLFTSLELLLEIELNEHEKTLMASRMLFDSKEINSQRFESDSDQKRRLLNNEQKKYIQDFTETERKRLFNPL